ncbi:hypothetical protein [Kitasatospora sp. MAP5-34]|uniref:hypothetical protein n=1 Tax=Kitasatospora sp. MAP5-34 TaxID=3035102 RepID=UPI002475309F|nr:hypothetical protein [Kitasatospora sp. MAP5-34]MDH6579491.1 hypothetical protein [Kitasatospora sp. MAP5-34]
MDTILLTVDAVLGVLGSALSLSVEIVRARRRAPAQQPNCPQGQAQLPGRGDDVDPRLPGQHRDAERLVRDPATHTVWYTGDHCTDFQQISSGCS